MEAWFLIVTVKFLLPHNRVTDQSNAYILSKMVCPGVSVAVQLDIPSFKIQIIEFMHNHFLHSSVNSGDAKT